MNIKTYHPISKIGVIPKICKQILLDRILPQINPSSQHGFLIHCLALSILGYYEQLIVHEIRNGAKQVDCVFTDLTKAFDNACHRLLLAKLSLYKVVWCPFPWLESYLCKMVLIVKVEIWDSDEFTPTSGFSQRSHLGPILFLLFINGVINVNLLLLPDDREMYNTVNNDKNGLVFQEKIFFLIAGVFCDNILSLMSLTFLSVLWYASPGAKFLLCFIVVSSIFL